MMVSESLLTLSKVFLKSMKLMYNESAIRGLFSNFS